MKKIKFSSLFIYTLFVVLSLASIYGIASAAFTPPPAGTPGTTNPTGTIGVANGGTGAITLSGVLVGNGTSAFTAIQPTLATAGNVLKVNSIGTAWISEAPAGGGSQWTTSGSNIYYNTGDVGIGTTPASGFKLYVIGTGGYGIASKASNVAGSNTAINLEASGAGSGINTGAYIAAANGTTNRGIYIETNYPPAGANNWAIYSASQANSYFAGNIGIGTTAPGTLLDLGLAGTRAGVLRLAGSASGNVTIQTAAAAGTATTLTLPAVTGKLLGTGAATSGQYASTKYTATTTLNWANGNVQYIQLASGAQTFTFANPLDGGRYILILKQPAAGAAGTVTWPATVLWPGGTAPTLTAANSKVDIIAFVYDATNIKYYAGSNLNF